MLLPIEVDEQLFKVIILFWDPSYRFFTFNQENLTSTIEEYSALLRISLANPDRIFLEEGEEGPVQEEASSDDDYRYKHPCFQDQAKEEE